MGKRLCFILMFLLSGTSVVLADEGMWMVNAIDAALEKKMQERGLLVSAKEIYDADAEGATLADAVVSLDFGCTGSIISGSGLLITNHHCAYSDIYSLSTPGHNLLEEGFWAMQSSEERPIPGKKAWFLKKVLDVTDEVKGMLSDAETQGKPLGFRKLSWTIERRYAESTGYEASLGSMWDGTRYYIALYEVYSDVRLVAAPPVSIAAFGGDIDNWEWPQHKCDFALYRVYSAPDGSPAGYSPENVPLRPSAVLDVSLDGYAPGDFTMVIGYPGSTDRYSSSFKVDFKENVTLPVMTSIRGEQMKIIDRWMNRDPAVRLMYSDYYFSLSNVQELNAGEAQCYRRFRVADRKRDLEERMRLWIGGDDSLKMKWGGLLDSLAAKYAAVEDIERNISIYRETIVRGTRLSRANFRLGLLKNEVLKGQRITPHRAIDTCPPSPEEIRCCRDYRFTGRDYHSVKDLLLKDYRELDMRVERDLFRYAIEKYYDSFDRALWGEYQKGLYDRHCPDGLSCDFDAIASYIWDSSFMTDTARLHKFISEPHTVDEYLADPFYRFMQDVSISSLNELSSEVEGKPTLLALDKEYTHALYGMRMSEGEPQYPDANSTMRVTYGTVGPVEPYDGVICSWRSTTAGILEKYAPDTYEFTLGERQRTLLEEADWGTWFNGGPESACEAAHSGGRPPMYVDFLTDNDITGGNSGSPVLNAEGKLIGLAFDGNKESLASDSWYTPGYNKCVCVDIRFVLWTLDRYAGMTRIIDEIFPDSLKCVCN